MAKMGNEVGTREGQATVCVAPGLLGSLCGRFNIKGPTALKKAAVKVPAAGLGTTATVGVYFGGPSMCSFQ